MKFSKNLFLKVANKNTKRLFSRYIDEMDGKEVTFTYNKKYGEVTLNDGDYIYPVYKEWCIEEQLELNIEKITEGH